LQFDDQQLWELYYTLLLKDLGCSSNAARISELYLTDDLSFKRDFKWVDGSISQALKFVVSHTGLNSSLSERFSTILNIFLNGGDIAQELIQTRCQRGAEIARQLRFSDPVAEGIHALDEHWDGSGRPDALSGQKIPIYARIALLSQVIDVFQVVNGPEAALTEARNRSGSWFDPELVKVFESLAGRQAFWQMLTSDDLTEAVLTLEPANETLVLDDDYLDEIAAAFGQIVDAKSPYTQGHSVRVAVYTEMIAEQLGLNASRRRWLKRGALLHDVGKLGVSNAVLDKPGKLNEDEWFSVQQHAAYTESILSRIKTFHELAVVSSAHHEKLDGSGYPHGLQADDISIETRIITTADIFDAITAERPYRGATPVNKTLKIMSEHVGTALDADCFAALETVIKERPELAEH
jgi:HD-GYP domain-containing protein (c-di-GMP phosphodiesterase class II)